MQNNPFSALIGMMRQEGKTFNPPSILIAEVVQSHPLPLIIQIGDLQLDKDNILINEVMQKDYKRKYQTSSNDVTYGTEGFIKFTDTIKQGDQLVVLPTDDRQTFVVLCKVVVPV